jgi:hypothetical protein
MLGLNEAKFDFSLKWFGTAPFCDSSISDVYQDLYIPILDDNYGDGSYCVTGRKILGIRPLNPSTKFISQVTELKNKYTNLEILTKETSQKVTQAMAEAAIALFKAL